jgi:hypothetical protein
VTATVSTDSTTTQRDAPAERLFTAPVGGTELLSIDLGRRLGLYTRLASRSATPPSCGSRPRLRPGLPMRGVSQRTRRPTVHRARRRHRAVDVRLERPALPATIAGSGAAANGAVLRETTVHTWARHAGFAASTTVAIDNDFWRFYRFDR